MATSIGPALLSIKSRLSERVAESAVERICRAAGHRWRRRVLDPPTTVNLMLLQLLAGVAMAGLRHVSQVTVSAAALCKAKMRLPLRVLTELVAETGGGGEGGEGGGGGGGATLWKGRHRVVLADGTTFTAADTPGLAKAYGKAANQTSARPGRPVVKLLALVDLASGLIARVVALPHARHEQTVLSRAFAALRPGDLLLGDRGLVSFAHVALLLAAGLHGCFRLPRYLVTHGHGTPGRRRQRRLGRQDLLVRWARPPRHTLGWLSRRRWAQLPSTLTLRQVAFRLRRPGFRTRWAWAVTTLLDPAAYPAQDVVDLYGRRWQVEVCFRDLKATLGMRRLAARTVDGARKEVLAFVVLYNLVRQVMVEAAARQAVEPDRVSFRDAMTWLLWAPPGQPLADLRVNPARPRPTEPRARTHGGYQFPVLSKPRDQLRKPRAEAVI